MHMIALLTLYAMLKIVFVCSLSWLLSAEAIAHGVTPMYRLYFSGWTTWQTRWARCRKKRSDRYGALYCVWGKSQGGIV